MYLNLVSHCNVHFSDPPLLKKFTNNFWGPTSTRTSRVHLLQRAVQAVLIFLFTITQDESGHFTLPVISPFRSDLACP
jgi:hypothetical protein